MQTNREDATALELDATPLSAVLQAYARVQPMTETSYKDTLKVLSNAATAGGDKPLPKPWPRTPRGLSGDLRRLAPALRTQSWTVIFHAHTMHGSGITILPPVAPPPPRMTRLMTVSMTVMTVAKINRHGITPIKIILMTVMTVMTVLYARIIF